MKQITTNLYQGVNSAGVQAAWLDESATAGTANYQGVGRINVYVKKAAAWVYGTLEANEDTNFAEQLPGMIQDAKDVLEETSLRDQHRREQRQHRRPPRGPRRARHRAAGQRRRVRCHRRR